MTRQWGRAAAGAPALLRALCEEPAGVAIAGRLLRGSGEPATDRASVAAAADALEERAAEDAWRHRRRVRDTADPPGS